MIDKAHMRKGFTLIELLVVVVIIGILAGIGVKGFASAQDRARNSSMMSNTRTVFLGIESWKTDNNGVPVELINDSGATGKANTVAFDEPGVPSDWPKYVPGGLLPKTPWSGKPQLKVAAGTLNADYAGESAGKLKDTITMTGDQANQPDFRLGDKGILSDGLEGTSGGTVPGANGPEKRTDYGYMFYLGDSGTGRYAILGVGKFEGKPYIVAVKTNFN